MIKWITGKKLHFVFWAVLLVFIASANSFYINLFLKNGKPYRLVLPLPAESSDSIIRLGLLGTARLGGQDLFELRGFAFNLADPTAANKISVVFRSASQTLVFAASPITVPGMIKTYAAYKPGMDQAEFSLFLSQAVFKPGVYKIGVLLENTAGSDRTLMMTSSQITVTPNTITLKP